MTAAINLLCEPNPSLWGRKVKQPDPSLFTITDEDGISKLILSDESGASQFTVADQ